MNDRQSSISQPPQAAGYLLSKAGLLALLAGLAVAAWNGQAVIVVLLGLPLAAAGLAKLWSRLSLKGLHCERMLSERRAFPGERIEVRLRLVNRKLLPLPWAQLDDEIPYAFAPDIGLAPSEHMGRGHLSNGAALLWYSAVNWRHTLQCDKRGYYALGPMRVTSGDIFGFYPRVRTDQVTDHIIVYPKVFPVERLGIPSLYPLGDARAERRIFEDPTRVVGVREYTPHDSPRRIHWKATARRQNLQVKVLEPTTTLNVAIFLAADSFEHGDASLEADFELGISAAASVASHVIGQGSPVGVYSNARLADSGQAARIPPATGTGQLVGLLEALAKHTTRHSGPFEEFLQQERKELPWGTTSVIVLSKPSEPVKGLLADMREHGQKLVVLQAGGQAASCAVEGIPWHKVRDVMGDGKSSPVEAA